LPFVLFIIAVDARMVAATGGENGGGDARRGSGGENLSNAALQAVADAAAAAVVVGAATENRQQGRQQTIPKPPKPLPIGWFLKESRSQPGCYYYFNQESGLSTWIAPTTTEDAAVVEDAEAAAAVDDNGTAVAAAALDRQQQDALHAVAAASAAGGASGSSSDRKRSSSSDATTGAATTAAADDDDDVDGRKSKKSRRDRPSKVRVLHILRKHKDSRRPSSWRQKTISITKEEAREQIKELRELLEDESGENLKATFEELARTESDCSSAKRGGDLGYFGPKKMQPAFEEASFALDVGDLSGLVDTSSGVHIILRIG